MSKAMNVIGTVLFGVVAAFGQSGNAVGRGPVLVPSEPIEVVERAAKALVTDKPPVTAVTPHRLEIRPSGDPIYVVEEREWNGGEWLTYRRPKVDPFSRDADGVALKGYDVISYLEKRDEKGSKVNVASFGGVTWWFTSAEHRRMFLADPAQFVPQYGGFCAYSVGRGAAATADPRVYSVVGGKLYLFFDPAVKTVWEQEQKVSITNADRNWPKLHR